jgi:UDP-GlcNAc:undecaprenyl-phosphate GlcNAc-1-phosphate transferase
MRLGHGHRRAVTILWLWTAVLSGIVLVPTYDIAKGTLNFLMPFLLAVFGLLLYAIFAPGARGVRLRRLGTAQAAGPGGAGPDPDAPTDTDEAADVIALEERRRARG